MNDKILVVLRGETFEAVRKACAILGVRVADPGANCLIEERLGDCVSPPFIRSDGQVCFALLLRDEQALLLPQAIDPPEVIQDWRSNELNVLGERESYPEYEVSVIDDDGKAITRAQKMHWISCGIEII